MTTRLKDTRTPRLSPRDRLARSIERSDRPNPLRPILLHAIERGLGDSTGRSEMDMAVQRVLRRHPDVPRDLLRRLVDDYRALPEPVRNRGVPQQFLNLPADTPMRLQDLGNVVFKAKWIASTAKLADLLELTVFAPHISGLEPKAATYSPGQAVTIQGSNFAKQAAKNKVTIWREHVVDVDLNPKKVIVATLTPASASATKLGITLPNTLGSDIYYLEVASVGTDGKTRDSNVVSFQTPSSPPSLPPPPPTPTITSITPPGRRPGQKVLVQGTNFGFASSGSGFLRVVVQPMDTNAFAAIVPTSAYSSPIAGMQFKLLTNTQIEVTFSNNMPPGLYRIAIEHVGNLSKSISNWALYDVRPYKYRVNFLEMRCIDESDPEKVLGQNIIHDELVTAWVVAADLEAWAKNTGEVQGFDDGTVKPYAPGDRAVFVPGGTAGEVGQLLAIATQLHEWDEGDVQAANRVVDFIGDLAGEIAKALANSAPTVAAVAAIISMMAPFIQEFVTWAGGNPDFLGERVLAWDALELQQQTANPAGKFGGTLSFHNDDDTVSYDLTYEVARVAE